MAISTKIIRKNTVRVLGQQKIYRFNDYPRIWGAITPRNFALKKTFPYYAAMAHVHTEPGQHDHTVSAIITRVDGDQPKAMLHRHKKLGVYMQFGGHIELDETPWDAMVKEIREESGYDIGQLTILQPTDRLCRMSRATVHPQPMNYNTHDVGTENQHFHTDVVYAFEARDEPRNTPEEGESNDFRLFTHQELLDAPEEEISENAREAAQFILEEISHRWERIPAYHI